MQSRPDAVFGVIPPGLEQVLAEELTDLGVREPTIEEGGVSFRADRELLYHIHRWGRSGNRFWVRLGRFHATTMEALAAKIRALPWAPFVHPHRSLTVRVSATRSRLSHRDAIANKVELAVRDALRGPRREGAKPAREPLDVLVRLVDDEAEVSVDASGDRLHRRGWRKDIVAAPLRENLAAAVLWLSGWQLGTPLVDPMCGSGTFLIEAAGIAAGHAPGDQRNFAFETWPSHDRTLWKTVLARKGEPREHAHESLFLGCDIDEDAVVAAKANARRARVSPDLRACDLRELVLPSVAGTIIVNPPYGERLSRPREAWGALAQWLALRASGWRVTVISPDPALARIAGFKGKPVAVFPNGGIRVGVYTIERYER